MDKKKQLIVIGAGPAGYAAAFHAADLGIDVTLIDNGDNPGGVCLYRGCIPSKALLHAAKLLREAEEAKSWGIEFSKPTIKLGRLREWKAGVVSKLTGGLGQLCKARRIRYIQGTARYVSSKVIETVDQTGRKELVTVDQSILATGSRPVTIPNISIDDDRVMDSTSALEIEEIPPALLVIGGGYIGLELGAVYRELGSKVTVIEMTSGLLPGADRDLVDILARQLAVRSFDIRLNTKVESVKATPSGLSVTFTDASGAGTSQSFDRILVAVGRAPNTSGIGLENTGVELDRRGFAVVNNQRQTRDPAIFAIGDVAGEPMLAHKGTHEGIVAAETLAGHKVAFEPNAIPAVVFTDPEIAWCGLTETEAANQQRSVRVRKFPWSASGRAMTLGRNDGLTKLVVEAETQRVLGVGICGPGAGELIAEGTLAVEMAANATDLKMVIHPHPTLSETVMETAELFFGPSTHLYRAKKNGD